MLMSLIRNTKVYKQIAKKMIETPTTLTEGKIRKAVYTNL